MGLRLAENSPSHSMSTISWLPAPSRYLLCEHYVLRQIVLPDNALHEVFQAVVINKLTHQQMIDRIQ